MKFKSLLCVLVALSISCTRAKNDTANVVLELPALPQQKADFSLLNFTDNPDDYDDVDSWSTIVPSGIDTGDYPINCYAVMVGGPESMFQDNYCGRKSAADDSIEKMFSFGPWVGAVPAVATGNQIELEVSPGKDRVLYLVGFHALSASACTDLKSSSPLQSQLTRPYIISQVGQVNLEAGTSTTIPMTRLLNTEKWFDECKFKLSTDSGGVKNATKIGIQKLTAPEKSVIASANIEYTNPGDAICSPFKVRLMDDQFNPARHEDVIKVKLNHCQTTSSTLCYDHQNPNTSGFSVLDTYDNYSDCADSDESDGRDDFDIVGSERYTIRWIRSPVIGVNHMFVQPEAINPPTPFTLKTPEKFSVRNTSQRIAYLEGPSKIRAGECYKYTATNMSHNFVAQTGGTIAGLQLLKEIAPNSWVDLNTNINPHIFMDSNCAVASPWVIPAASTWSSEVFYIKAPASQNLKLAATGTGVDEDFLFIAASTGTSTPKVVRVTGPQVVKNNVCHKVSLSLLNESRAVVPALATGNTFSLIPRPAVGNSPIDIRNLDFYSNSSCTTQITGAPPAFTIPTGQTSYEFYMKSSAVGEDSRYVRFANGLGIFVDVELNLYGN